MTPQRESASKPSGLGRSVGLFFGGLVVGLVVAGVAVWMLAPGMMLVTHESRLGFDETVAALEEAAEAEGWVVSGTRDMNASLAQHGQELPRRVRIVELCHPEYARDILTTDRELSSMMPCAISVWETDAGEVRVTQMNTGLVGRMFGGNVARVMGGRVAEDERSIVSAVVVD